MVNNSFNRSSEFYKIYQEEILPIFNSYESFRKKELFFFWLCCILAMPLVTIILWGNYFLIMAYRWNQDLFLVALFLVALLGGIGVIIIWKARIRARNFSLSIKRDCLSKLLKVFGEVKWVNGSNIINDDELNTIGLFATYNRRNTDDEFLGTYKGVPFRICETKLWNESGSSSNKIKIPVFKGVVISFKSNKIIKNRTIVATKNDLTRKNTYWIYLAILAYLAFWYIFDYKNILHLVFILIAIIFFAWLYRDDMKMQELLEPVILEDPKFCKKFNVYSSNQVEARYLITNTFMERFQNLNTSFAAKKAKCSFCGDELFFAINTNKNLFEIGSIFRSLKNPKSINEFYNELSSIFDLIEFFKLDEKTGF